MCSYADSGPWWWGARPFDGLGTVTNGFSTKNGVRTAVLINDFYDLVLFWTPLRRICIYHLGQNKSPTYLANLL